MKRFFTLRILLFTVLAFLADMKLSIYGFRPDFVSFMAYWFGYSRSSGGGMLYGAAVGAAEDSLYMGLIGPGMLSKGLIGFFASFLSRGFFRWTPLLGFFGAMALTLAGGFAQLAVLSVFSRHAEGFSTGGALILLAQALLNGVLGIFWRPEIKERES